MDTPNVIAARKLAVDADAARDAAIRAANSKRQDALSAIAKDAEDKIRTIQREAEAKQKAAEALHAEDLAAADVGLRKAQIDAQAAMATAKSEAAVAALPALGAARSAAQQAHRMLQSEKTGDTPEAALAYDVRLRQAEEAATIASNAYREALEAVKPEHASAILANVTRK